MFDNCYTLKSVPPLDTGNGANVGSMFHSCYSLQTIPLLNIQSAGSCLDIVASCYALGSLRLVMSGAVSALDVRDTALSREALVRLFGDLYDRAGLSPGVISVARALGAGALTESDLQTAAARNWTVDVT